jgi:vacuolar-type H+-ATPase subunit E/Vma4
MEQVIGSIRALSRAILDETKASAERSVQRASVTAGETLEAAQEKAAQEASEVAVAADVKIAHLEQQSLALAKLDAQRIRLEHREEVIERVFSRAEEQLEQIRESPDYHDLMCRLIIDGVERMGQPEDVIVLVSVRDGELLEADTLKEVEERWRGRVQLSLGVSDEVDDGVVLETPDGHRRCDNSLRTRLAREKPRLRAEVCRLLLGEV